jgi:DNA-directed RNA polymerase sigma subunit (sigma70/sigma32)
MDVPVGKVQLLLQSVKTPYSLEMPVGEDTELGALLEDRNVRTREEMVLHGDLASQVERAMAPLNDRERVRQLEARALAKLRHAQEDEPRAHRRSA